MKGVQSEGKTHTHTHTRFFACFPINERKTGRRGIQPNSNPMTRITVTKTKSNQPGTI